MGKLDFNLGLNARAGEGVYLPVHRGRQIARALIAVALVLSLGTVGFTWIENWHPLRALYFTLITVTTVGYGDEGISEAGRYFALVLLIGGIAVFSWSFSTMVQSAVSHELRWKTRMQKHIKRLADHTIVCGFGRIGQVVARELREAGTALVIVERDPERLREALELDYAVIEGCASEDQVLVQAGIERARHLVSVVDGEVENIVISLTARGLNEGLHIIARAETKADESKLLRAGANRVVCPFHAGGHDIAGSILRPGVAAFLARTHAVEGDVALAEIRIADGSALAGRRLGEYGKEEGAGIAFVALERDGARREIPPPGKRELVVGDLLIVAGDPEQVARMSSEARAPSRAA